MYHPLFRPFLLPFPSVSPSSIILHPPYFPLLIDPPIHILFLLFFVLLPLSAYLLTSSYLLTCFLLFRNLNTFRNKIFNSSFPCVSVAIISLEDGAMKYPVKVKTSIMYGGNIGGSRVPHNCWKDAPTVV